MTLTYEQFRTEVNKVYGPATFSDNSPHFYVARVQGFSQQHVMYQCSRCTWYVNGTPQARGLGTPDESSIPEWTDEWGAVAGDNT